MAGESILVVDDNVSNLVLTGDLLTSEGYRVKTATSADSALKTLESFSPKLILMDVQMPEVDGLELTQKLKASDATRSIIIIALTAYAMGGDKEKAMAGGC